MMKILFFLLSMLFNSSVASRLAKSRTLPVPGLPASMMQKFSGSAVLLNITSSSEDFVVGDAEEPSEEARGETRREPARAPALTPSPRPRTGREVARARDAVALRASRAGATARGAARALAATLAVAILRVGLPRDVRDEAAGGDAV